MAIRIRSRLKEPKPCSPEAALNLWGLRKYGKYILAEAFDHITTRASSKPEASASKQATPAIASERLNDAYLAAVWIGVMWVLRKLRLVTCKLPLVECRTALLNQLLCRGIVTSIFLQPLQERGTLKLKLVADLGSLRYLAAQEAKGDALEPAWNPRRVVIYVSYTSLTLNTSGD